MLSPGNAPGLPLYRLSYGDDVVLDCWCMNVGVGLNIGMTLVKAAVIAKAVSPESMACGSMLVSAAATAVAASVRNGATSRRTNLTTVPHPTGGQSSASPSLY